MDRDERRHARTASLIRNGSRLGEFSMEPDFDIDLKSRLRTPAQYRLVTELSFLMDGEVMNFTSIMLDGKPIEPPFYELAYATGSGSLQRCSCSPKIPTNVYWSLVNLHDREEFYSDHELLAGALWSAKAPTFNNVTISIEKLQSYVPSYAIIKGKKFIRLRDCLDFLRYALFFDRKIALTLTS